MLGYVIRRCALDGLLLMITVNDNGILRYWVSQYVTLGRYEHPPEYGLTYGEQWHIMAEEITNGKSHEKN